jgi:Leucine-rich repeat (LRR) protein
MLMMLGQDTFGKLKALRTLSLSNCGLTSLGSQKLTLLKNLETVDLENNKFSGAIPKWLGGLTFSSPLTAMLVLSGSPFTGSIPGELCNIKGLISLYIANTQVTAIPSQIGNCQSLKVLDLVNNKLRGSLPAGLSKLRMLETLALGSYKKNFNRLTGTLPAALGDLPNLLDFDIANNDFYGRIPANYGPFAIFKVPSDKTRFQGNNLSGTCTMQSLYTHLLVSFVESWIQMRA